MTTVLVALEHHFIRTPDGVFTDMAFGRDVWREYLDVFDRVVVLARVGHADTPPPETFPADGPGIEFVDLYNYRGLASFMLTWPVVWFQTGRAVKRADAYILRSGTIGIMMWLHLKLRRRKYACEFGGRAGPAIAAEGGWLFGRIAKLSEWLSARQARGAIAASYTSRFLQQCYPTGHGDAEWVFSTVRITDDAVTAPRSASHFTQRPFNLVSVGRVERQKGHHCLLDAASVLTLRDDVPEWTLTIVGGGSQVPVLRQRVTDYGLADRVKIVGAVEWGPKLFEYFDQAHLFVLPSLTEGMPRALIEGMARGLPAVGSDTGGIPELLDDRFLAPPGDAEVLAAKLAEIMTADPNDLAGASRKNFQRAGEYHVDKTSRKKHAFWERIKDEADGTDD